MPRKTRRQAEIARFSGNFRRVKRALSSSGDDSNDSVSEDEIKPRIKRSKRVVAVIDSSEEEDETPSRIPSFASLPSSKNDSTINSTINSTVSSIGSSKLSKSSNTSKSEKSTQNTSFTSVIDSTDVTTSDSDNDFLSRKCQDMDEVKKKRKSKGKTARRRKETSYISSSSDSEPSHNRSFTPHHEKLARQVHNVLDSDDSSKPPSLHTSELTSEEENQNGSQTDDTQDFIDDTEVDPNLSSHVSILNQLDESLHQQFSSQGSAEFTFEDFKILCCTLIQDVTSKFPRGCYLDKINRPHHYENHKKEHFAMNRVQDAIKRAGSGLKSYAWNETVLYVLSNYPKMQVDNVSKIEKIKERLEEYHENQSKKHTLKSPKTRKSPTDFDKCDVCRRQDGDKTVATLSGFMYDQKTFELKETRKVYESHSDESENDIVEMEKETKSKSRFDKTKNIDGYKKILSPKGTKSRDVQKLYCGSFCGMRVQRYHRITHFIFNEIYEKLLKLNEREDYTAVEVGKKRRKAMIERLGQDWMKTCYLSLKEDIQNAHDFSNQTGVWYQTWRK